MLSKVRYCNNCNQTVAPKKNVSFIILVLLLLFLILPGIIYLIYCLVQKGKCPMCNGQNWGNVGSNGQINTTSTPKVWKSAVPVISSQGHASGVVHQFAKRPSSQVQVDQWQNGAKYKWQLLFLHMAGNSLNLPQEYHFS